MFSPHLEHLHQQAARLQVDALIDRVRLDPAYRPSLLRRVEPFLQISGFLVVAAVMAFSAWSSP